MNWLQHPVLVATILQASSHLESRLCGQTHATCMGVMILRGHAGQPLQGLGLAREIITIVQWASSPHFGACARMHILNCWKRSSRIMQARALQSMSRVRVMTSKYQSRYASIEEAWQLRHLVLFGYYVYSSACLVDTYAVDKRSHGACTTISIGEGTSSGRR